MRRTSFFVAPLTVLLSCNILFGFGCCKKIPRKKTEERQYRKRPDNRKAKTSIRPRRTSNEIISEKAGKGNPFAMYALRGYFGFAG